MSVWLYTIISVFIVSLTSFVGVVTLSIKQKLLKKIVIFFVSFSAGALLGGVFLHLLPELVESGSFNIATSFYILFGIILFFSLEKILNWRHCHLTATEEHVHSFAYMNLIGDALHNFTDGMVIAGSFMIGIKMGIATTVAVILHEIPQEMGDFGVLIHAGMKAKKALFFNFLSALTAVLGAVFILSLKIDPESVFKYVVPFTIGGFLYIANSDLIPELHKDTKKINSLIQLFSLSLGVLLMYLILFLHIG